MFLKHLVHTYVVDIIWLYVQILRNLMVIYNYLFIFEFLVHSPVHEYMELKYMSTWNSSNTCLMKRTNKGLAVKIQKLCL